MEDVIKYLIFGLKIIAILLFGGVLYANWFFIATIILQDIMMGSGLVAMGLAFLLTFYLSNKLFSFKRKWIFSIVLAICSYFVGEIFIAYGFNYRSCKYPKDEKMTSLLNSYKN